MGDYLALSPVLVLALVLSFFLSGMEAGVLALSPIRIRQWMRVGRPRAGVLHGFLQKPEDFLWTILVGNTLANFTAVSLVVLLLHEFLGERPWIAGGVFIVLVLAVYAVCDLLPKILFQSYPNRLCLALVGPFRVVHTLLRPLVAAVSWLVRILSSRTGKPAYAGRLYGSREELRQVIQESEQALTSEERRMISRVLDLPTVTVGQCMTPLDRAATVSARAPTRDALELCRRSGFTRLPIWQERGSERRIAGVLSLKTLLYLEDLDREKACGEYLKPALYLGEEDNLEAALRRMQRSGQRLAIVLGPGRREVGVISLEDILGFIFGAVSL